MIHEGPLLETLTRRLAETPPDFVAEPRIGQTGTVQVAAVVGDLVRELGGDPLTAQAAASFQSSHARRDRNRLRLTLIVCWLLFDPWFPARRGLAEVARRLLTEGLQEPAALTEATKFVSDPDRREELVRLCLKELGLRPAGETLAQAQDRLATLNSAERQRVIKAAREAEERAQQIRAAMAARKAAEEAANLKAMRE